MENQGLTLRRRDLREKDNVDKENAPMRSLGGRKMESSALSSNKLGLKTQRSALLDKCMNKRKRTLTEKSTNRQNDTQQTNDDVKAFLDDNAERYKSKDQSQQQQQRQQQQHRRQPPLPILPIIVPDHIRHCFASGKYVPPAETTPSTPFQAKPKPSASSSAAAAAPVPTIDRSRLSTEDDKQVCDAALAYEVKQETRARQVRLRENNVMDWTDPLLVAEYEEDIFDHLRKSEITTLGSPMYASNDPLENEITWKMRGVLIDWVVEVHYLFQLLPETLFLAVNIIDRFLTKRSVSVGKLQLVGLAALFIATKFEEVAAPRIRDFIFMTDDQNIKEEDLIKAERFVLQVLDYKLCFSNPLNFLRRASKTEDYDLHSRMLSKYFMEISCVDHRFIAIPPSKVAAAALWLSQRMLANGSWTPEIAYLSGYTTSELKPIVRLMLDFLSQPVAHDAFFRKWGSRQLMKASVFVRNWVTHYYKNKSKRQQ
ncbi:hypothetical protein O0I10_007802 [Lichtheimia ornata]|uniref:Cyclin N-terminal domain-containing protein n=1 Tax=Lichtheimia ornata TaxID=688661 RepID=A0AAD7XTJ5_9FUNG|nr:uncharacterized protein O0I10_007802 [Lichtheimia ornata]KAJ8656479.1 hypothetical protein O0I10_007802 [Lichtheimia ornata]